MFVKERTKRIRIAAGAFMLALMAPELGKVLLPPSTPGAEHRRLAVFPAYNSGIVAAIDSSHELDRFLADRLGFRNAFLSFHQFLFHNVFRVAASESVFYGKENWLFLKSSDLMPTSQAQDHLPTRVAKRWKRYIQRRSEKLKALGKLYLFVVVPEKHTIYPEYLPFGMKNDSRPTYLQVMSNLWEREKTENALDLTKPLLENKAEGVLYYSTDTHWNALGAHIGYQAILNWVNRNKIGGEKLSLFQPRFSRSDSYNGDLAQIENLKLFDQVVKATPRVDSCVQQLFPLIPPELEAEGEPAGAFICSKGKGSVVLFGDSYSEMLRPYLSSSFAHALYLRVPNSMPALERAISLANPDIVIEEMAERFFYNGTAEE